MFSSVGIEIITIFILFVANGFFAASEIATVSARRSRLQQQVDAGQKRAQQALDLARNPERFLATVQVGMTLINTLAAALGGASLSEPLAAWLNTIPLLKPYANTLALTLVVLLITYFSLVLGELVPKRLALQYAERVATRVAPMLVTLAKVTHPAIVLLTMSSNLVLRLIGQKRAIRHEVTEEDIVYLTHEGITSGTVEQGEEEFIKRIFRFTDRAVRMVMKPRNEIVAIEAGTPLPEVVHMFLDSGYTRLPVYQDSLDNITGILYAKDLLRSITARETFNYMECLREPFFALEHQHVDDLLATFRRQRVHIAIVLDEYSQVSGLVTIEDLLEELVGEIQDEYDIQEESAILQRDDGSWLVDAGENYETVRDRVGLPPMPPEELGEYQSLGGLIQTHLDRIPVEGDKVQIGTFTLEVIDMDGRRIDKILIQPDK
ncbi:MAG: HlyC/CorC family transporter [Ktedonobacteraceae bacterium]|nr:HlyC/CorC family transporter [Ktedonobacteraceae bacterium]